MKGFWLEDLGKSLTPLVSLKNISLNTRGYLNKPLIIKSLSSCQNIVDISKGLEKIGQGLKSLRSLESIKIDLFE